MLLWACAAVLSCFWNLFFVVVVRVRLVLLLLSTGVLVETGVQKTKTCKKKLILFLKTSWTSLTPACVLVETGVQKMKKT
jgi:hypothetical protein